MMIKLNFTRAVEVSPLQKQDTLVFHIKDKGHNFISETLLVDLHSNYTTLTRPLLKQMFDNQLSRSLITSSINVKDSLIGTTIFTVVVNIFIQGAFSRIL